MSIDTLFLLDPHVHVVDGAERFCPPCAMVTGYLKYYPAVAEKIRIVTVSPVRPRQAIIEAIGEENQGSPVLVLADESHVDDSEITVQFYHGKRFINDARAILRYLGTTYDGGLAL